MEKAMTCSQTMEELEKEGEPMGWGVLGFIVSLTALCVLEKTLDNH